MNRISPGVSSRIDRAGRDAFGDDWRPERYVAAPGRIEVIGNHVDYNGGPVLAAAIDRQVVVAVAGNSDRRSIRVVFADTGDLRPQTINLPLPADWRSSTPEPQAVDYLRGVIAALSSRRIAIRQGTDLVVSGDLPFGIGISSSAALCVALVHAVAVALPGKTEIILIAQEAEHRVGSPCGTMDQSASVYGGLIRFDGSPDAIQPVTADLTGLRFVVINSGVVRSLATSSYPRRVGETKRALELLQRRWQADLTSLASLGHENLDSAIQHLESESEPILAKRVRHVVTECQRVREAEEAVTRSDWTRVGELMTTSGRSSATDYDVSHPRVEDLVLIARQSPGVLGARMMGGGEGGSALVLVREDSLAELKARLDREFFSPMGSNAPGLRTLACRFAEGAGGVELAQAS